MTFDELAKKQKEALKKQKGFTYEEMLEIQRQVKERSMKNKKKKTK